MVTHRDLLHGHAAGLAAQALAPYLPVSHTGGVVDALANLVVRLTPKRRSAQFSLGSLFLLVTVLCFVLALWVVPAERQRRAVAAIEEIGGEVQYVKGDTKRLMRRWLPHDYLDEVFAVDFSFSALTDAGLAHLQGLRSLQALFLDGTQVTDAGLTHLRGLKGLRVLFLDETRVTDAGLAHLHELTGLQVLYLNRTLATDAGLAHLQGLTGLRVLYFNDTQVTDDGLAHLHAQKDLGVLSLENTQVTDAGLVQLQPLTGLMVLRLDRTHVTDTGVARLEKVLPNCDIVGP